MIYHFIVYGFALGRKVTEALHVPWVQRMFEIYRRSRNEAHYYLEFIRFEEISWQGQAVLYAVIEPENEVIDTVASHFTDRLNPEWFIIYDKTHHKAAFHNPGRRWYQRMLEPDECILSTVENGSMRICGRHSLKVLRSRSGRMRICRERIFLCITGSI